MKNPNGYGSVYKLSGKRRKPFGVRKTAGWEIDEKTGKLKQLYDNIGYYKSRQEAMIALAEYNKAPYDLDAKKITFAKMYELWSNEKFSTENLSDKENKKAYTMAYKHAHFLHKLKFINIKKSHMQDVINKCEKGHSTKSKIKTLFSQMYKYALENDLTEKDYSKFVTVPPNEKQSTRKPFTLEEIELLWKNIDVEFVDTALIMIYTGLRPGELVTIENEKINLEERYMRGGIKTRAGINRIIPINKKIYPLIEKRMDKNNQFLMVNSKGTKMSYTTYRRDKWKPLMEKIKMNHRAHDCRHTFATLMDNAGANKLSIKKIMGHSSQDITDQVYTHKDIEQLVKAIDLI